MLMLKRLAMKSVKSVWSCVKCLHDIMPPTCTKEGELPGLKADIAWNLIALPEQPVLKMQKRWAAVLLLK